MPSTRRPAVFLDRDGTLIEDRGCLQRKKDIAFLPGVLEGLRLLSPHFSLVMITNQPWISRGLLTLQKLTAINDAIRNQLENAGIPLLGWYACPHTREEGCACIKPKPALGKRAAAEHRLDLKRSWTIGDHPHDIAFAWSLGARGGVYLLSGHGSRHFAELDDRVSYIASDFMDAAQWILRQKT